MPPIASTSLTPAHAPPTVTTTRRASARPTRKVKRPPVYVPPTYDFDLPVEEANDDEGRDRPRSRQLKRQKKSETAERGKGKKGTGAEDEDEEMGRGTGEPTTSKGKGKGKGKGKIQAELKERKKTVRIALPDSSDSGWPGSDASSSSAASTSSETYGGRLSTRRRRRSDPLHADDLLSLPSDSDPEARTADNDYANPACLPPAVHRRSKKYWRSLEYGVYKSAVHDVAKASADLGRLLVQWDALRRRREAEQKEELEERRRRRDDEGSDSATPRLDEADDGAGVSGSPTSMSKSGRPKRPRLPSHNPSRSLTPYTVGGYETGDTIGGEADEGEQVEVLALPSSAALGRMTRWPLHESAFGVHEGGGARRAPELEDELASLIARARTRARRQGRIAQSTKAKEEKAKPRSAYAAGGPFAHYSPASPSSSSSSDAESDLSVPLESDLDAPSPSNPTAPIVSILSSLVFRLLDFVPKVPLPAYDIWAAEKREKNMRTVALEEAEEEKEGEGAEDEEEKERRQEEGVPGWEEVVALARESGDVADHVVDKLEKQLIALYGPSQRLPVVLPLLGGVPALQLVPNLPKETRKRAPRRKCKEKDAAVIEAQSAEGVPRPDPFPSASRTASASLSLPLPLPHAVDVEMSHLELPTPPAHFFHAERST